MRFRFPSWVLSLFVFFACQSSSVAPPSQSAPSVAAPTMAAPSVAAPPVRLDWAKSERGGALPPQLTGTDGVGLALVSLEAQVVVQAPLAFTELRMRFRNPESRVREGNFEITLPTTAALSRFAMKVGDRFQEGEVVERKAAQRVYEDFLHRRQDPALLEHDAGNRFRARVFPIAANADKEIILSYSEELSAQGDDYRLHLAGLPVLPSLKVRVLASDGEHTLAQDNAEPRGDLLLSGGRAALTDLALRAGDLYLLRTQPKLDDTPATFSALTILFDTSASGALGFEARAERVLRLTEQLAKQAKQDFEVRLVTFDQTTKPVFVGPASRLLAEGLPALRKRGALGASDLAQALTALAKEKLSDRLLLVSDAVVTAGEQASAKLVDAVSTLSAQGLHRLDVLLVGGIYDEGLARSLVTAKLPQVGVVVRETAEDEDVLSALLRKPLADVPVQVNGASWWWPRQVPSLLPGEYVTVLAALKDNQAPEVRVGQSQPVRPEPLEVAEPLLRRAWARAKLGELEARLAELDSGETAQRAQLESELTAISVRHRVLSSRTALLVLETEADYQRYGIARAGLSDILTVGESGLVVLEGTQRAQQIAAFAGDGREQAKTSDERSKSVASESDRREAPISPADDASEPSAASASSEPMVQPDSNAASASDDEKREQSAAPPPSAAPSPAAEEERAPRASGLSGLGRAGGGGRRVGDLGSVGRGEGASLAEASQLSGIVSLLGLDQVSGERDVHSVERQFATRKRALQVCYEQQLRRNPVLQGMVGFRMSIGEDGAVANVEVVLNTANDGALAECVVQTVRRFRFEPLTSSTQPGPSVFEGHARFVPGEARESRPAARLQVAAPQADAEERDEPPELTLDQALEGPLLSVLNSLQAGNVQGALEQAWRFRADDPASVLALVALGQALVAHNEHEEAARAFGSIIDLFPSRTDLRRTAGNYLEPLAEPSSLTLALDTYQKAREQRPDHPNSHRLYAWSLLKAGRHGEAFQALREGHARSYPENRFAGAKQILAEDLRIVASVWKAADASVAQRVDSDLRALALQPDTTPSLRFILSWETDANDVDFHLYDGKHGHAYYSSRELRSGGSLLADVTTGYGPERFRVDRPKAYPYQLVAHYYSRGPMGFGMGKVQVAYHDGKGKVTFDERPFVIMKDQASIGLGVIRGNETLFLHSVPKAKSTPKS